MLPINITHQTQPSAMSCVSTCLAMLLDRPVQEVMDHYHEAYFVKQEIEVAHILDENNIEFHRELAGTVLRLEPGRVYMLTVASLNIPGGLHQIIVDYRNASAPVALDPAKGYSNRKYYTLNSAEADDVPEAFVLFSWIIDYTLP